jgi:hypothetical protein
MQKGITQKDHMDLRVENLTLWHARHDTSTIVAGVLRMPLGNLATCSPYVAQKPNDKDFRD